ncbi:MAG: Shedu anti-phage system protein SduA domain-containing protein [Candidatus Limnocylindrales bacterium]
MEPDLPEGYEYEIDHKPWGIAVGSDIELSLRESDDGRDTRRVLRWHSGVKDGERRLSISLVHQRRNRRTGEWLDHHFDLRQLPAGQEVSLELDAEQTRKLIEHLDVLRQINERLKGERAPAYSVHREGEVVVSREFAAILEQLRGTSDPATVARNVATIAPDLADAAGILHQHHVRTEALAEFRRHLDSLDWAERDWQGFFERNDWIFGHGLDYRFMVTEETQPLYGGADITGSGGEQGDFFMGTVGDARFAVLVEIKRPDTDLLDGDRYRNGAWRASEHLAGGVAQLQANCQQWQVSSRQLPNAEWAMHRDLTTAQPEGILLIGRLRSIETDREQRESFERFRRHLWNPRVITFDELYARAEFIVARGSGENEAGPTAAQPDSDEPSWGDLDDLPF